MSDFECPYCGKDVEVNRGDMDCGEDALNPQECQSCEKVFTFTAHMHFTYTPYKADCLNDGEHDWQKTKTFPERFAKMRCKTCGDEKPIETHNVKLRGAALLRRPARTPGWTTNCSLQVVRTEFLHKKKHVLHLRLIVFIKMAMRCVVTQISP